MANAPVAIVVLWLIVSCPAFLVLPSIDDWVTAAPILSFRWAGLLPGVFWRPLEYVTRVLIGLAPDALFPWASHTFALMGHGVACAALFGILKRCSVPRTRAAISTAIAIMAPGTVAAVWSLDSAVQTCSTAMGLVSTWVLLRSSSTGQPLLWLLPALIAVLWKESGAGWFVAAPALAAYCNTWTTATPVGRRALLSSALGALIFLMYMAVRQTLAATAVLALGTADGRYALSLSPHVVFRNLAMLVGVAISTIDTIALLGRVRGVILVVATAGAGIPIVYWALRNSARHLTRERAILGAAALGAVAAPHVFLGHVSEMYAHPLVFVAVLLVSVPLRCAAVETRHVSWAVAAFMLGAAVSDGHKLYEMIATGRRAAMLGDVIARQVPAAPSRICVVLPQLSSRGYSVFQAAAGPASGWGRSAVGTSQWGWRTPFFFEEPTTSRCIAMKPEAILEFTSEESVHLASAGSDGGAMPQ